MHPSEQNGQAKQLAMLWYCTRAAVLGATSSVMWVAKNSGVLVVLLPPVASVQQPCRQSPTCRTAAYTHMHPQYIWRYPVHANTC
jgi:hypothetical protein